ncbi:helix-turn-helix domain-containing protein [Paenibacillus lautus]|uniref:helix-turn-helix domain-containing protein n=1 Tax=Paenibacillus lautus TaxID=1401 RepID=UPI001C11DB1E|nr:AraC family transcriptional regulator [Paenibacillus lautus]MBU5348306.1 AraC family transcriptional regulator [Paenibacillus lautus]
MDYEFFGGFTPRIIEVVHRHRPYWEEFDHAIKRECTGLHTLAYVYGGEGQLAFGGEKRKLAAGDLFQIWPGEKLLLTSSRMSQLGFYSFQFHYRTIYWEGGDMLSRKGASKLPLDLGSVGSEHVSIDVAFRSAYERWSDKNNGYEWHVKLQLLHIIDLIHQLSINSEDTSSGRSAVQKVIQWMKSDFRRVLSREELAERVSLSPAYFSVLFKEHTGISPIQYLNKIRIDHAKLLLRNTALPVKQIAEESGFSDSFYFSRLFHKVTGMSPRDFRNS